MTGKTALVTGGGSGLGVAISHRLARDGYAIGVLDMDLAGAQACAQAIVEGGGTAFAVQADISNREQVQKAVADVRSALGPITILINNAGITQFVPFEDLTDAQWDHMMAVNLRGPMTVTQTVLPDMKAAKWGRVVNISSSSAQSGAVHLAHYASSKGGVIALTRAFLV